MPSSSSPSSQSSYLDSGSHNSCVLISSVDNSVSVEPAEWAWFGVDGKLLLMNRFQVFFLSARSTFLFSRRSRWWRRLMEKGCILIYRWQWKRDLNFSIYSKSGEWFKKVSLNPHLMEVQRSQAIHSTNRSCSCSHNRPSFVAALPTAERSRCMSIALRPAECRSTQSIRQICTRGREFGTYLPLERMHDSVNN